MSLIETEAGTEEILSSLDVNLKTNKQAKCKELIELLLPHTRSSSDQSLRPLCTKRGLDVLGCYAFDHAAPIERRIALRCLNNILVRDASTRQVFVDEGYPQKVVQLMKIEDPDDELLTSNLLLYSTLTSSEHLTHHLEHDDLAGFINKNISRHAKASSALSTDPTSASNATLKLFSTLAVRYEAQAYRFLVSLDPLFDMLSNVDIPSPPLQPPLSLLIACLASLPIPVNRTVPAKSADKLLDILHSSVIAISGPSTEKQLLPLLLVLVRITQSNSSGAQSKLRERIFPSDEDRVKPLGQGDSLSHRLLRLASTSMEAEVRDCILTFFYELSKKNESLFIQNVGFGNAAGFLASKGISVSEDNLAVGDMANRQADYNPITGQLRNLESQSTLPDMTDEEKEREAERLFVLFEILQRTGVINVENPVAQAARSGRLEELPDDASDE